MKIAVSSMGKDLDAPIDQRFGRCPFFIIVETEDMSFETVQNDSAVLGGGAGIQSAQLVAANGAKFVITGNCGPNAGNTLAAAGIKLITGQSGTVKDAVARFKKGEFTVSTEANAPEFSGIGRVGTNGKIQSSPLGGGMGRGGGRGRGAGRGLGMGGGGGRSRGPALKKER